MQRRFRATFLVVCAGLYIANAAWAAEKPGPKNVILMVGDGMGFSQIEAASLYTHGKPRAQVYWGFQHVAVSTYSLNNKGGYDPERAWTSFAYFMEDAAESAASATALSTGVKTLKTTRSVY